LFSPPFNATTVRFLGFVYFVITVCTWFHLTTFLPRREDWETKIQDMKLPMYIVVDMGSSLVSALGFGKPYTPTVITVVGFFVNFGLAIIFPGLLEWLQNTLLLLCAHALLFQFFWGWWCRFY
jgi:hypothetical protein